MSNQNSDFVRGSALPFTTQDAILANCLRAAGFEETMLSPLNFYDADILFRAGGGIKDKSGKVIKPSRYAGLSIVEAARRAHREGQRGRVEYHFHHHPDIGKFCQIYFDQTCEIESGDDKKDAATRLLEIIKAQNSQSEQNNSADSVNSVSKESLFRILCIALKLRIEFVNRWKKQTPYLLVKEQGAGQTQKTSDGGELHTLPGGKMVPISAPDHTFKNLGLI